MYFSFTLLIIKKWRNEVRQVTAVYSEGRDGEGISYKGKGGSAHGPVNKHAKRKEHQHSLMCAAVMGGMEVMGGMGVMDGRVASLLSISLLSISYILYLYLIYIFYLLSISRGII